MSLSAADYGKTPDRRKWQDYQVPWLDWKLVPLQEHFAQVASLALESDAIRKSVDREQSSYLTYLDRWTYSYLPLFRSEADGNDRSLSRYQGSVLDATIRVYVEKYLKGRVDFWKRRVNGWGNPEFFEDLRQALDSIAFEWVNQTDLASLFEIEQSEISQPFNALREKGILVESWTQGKKKMFRIADVDLIGFYIMRYL